SWPRLESLVSTESLMASSSHLFSNGPLSDVRVIDLGHVIAGPFGATLMGDLGADVIKVEEPRQGDGMRRLGPTEKGVSLWWKVAARNKRSLALDLRSPDGRNTLLRLVEAADVLIENFRPTTLERWNLSPLVLHRINPRLVIVRISGYGQTDDLAGRPGYGRV